MMKSIEGLRDLYRFLEIAEQGNLTVVAERLGISQSALSRSVQALERSYGSRLLNRGKRGVQLTEAGQILAGRAREMMRLQEATLREIKACNGDPGGRVRIGLPMSTSRVFAAPLVARVAERYPRVLLAITEDVSENMEIGLSKGELDFAILVSPKTRRGKLHTSPFAAEQLQAIMPPGHSLAVREMIEWRDLAGQSIVAHPEGNFMRHWLTRMNQRYGLEIKLAAEVNSRTLMVELVETGLGIALLPGCAADVELACGRVVGRPIRDMRIVWSLAYDGQRQPSGAAERVQSVMQEIAEELAEEGIWTKVAGLHKRPG